MKEKSAIIIWILYTVVWIANLRLHLGMEDHETLLILSGLAIILGVINTVVSWQRYKKRKDSSNNSSEKA